MLWWLCYSGFWNDCKQWYKVQHIKTFSWKKTLLNPYLTIIGTKKGKKTKNISVSFTTVEPISAFDSVLIGSKDLNNGWSLFLSSKILAFSCNCPDLFRFGSINLASNNVKMLKKELPGMFSSAAETWTHKWDTDSTTLRQRFRICMQRGILGVYVIGQTVIRHFGKHFFLPLVRWAHFLQSWDQPCQISSKRLLTTVN